MQKRATVLLATAIMTLASISCIAGIVKAGETGEGEVSDVPISDPGTVAVVFADNMVYTPQFRDGNKIRLELMPLFVGSATDPASLVVGPALLGTDGSPIKSPTEAQLDATNYVSLPGLTVVVTGEEYSRTWTSDWTDQNPDQITKEVNSVGNLIYGIQWDTKVDEDSGVGTYTVTVQLPNVFPVEWVLMSDRDTGGLTDLTAAKGGLDLCGDAYINLNIVARGGGHGGSDGAGGLGSGPKWQGGK